MLKEIIQSFLPWILFFILAGRTQQQLDIAIISAAVIAILFEFKALKKGFVLSWGTLIFFIFMLFAVVYLKHPGVSKYSWIFSNGALATIVWISVLIGKPFTIQYAKEQVPQDKWKHPLFLKINYILTSVWGLIFSMGLILALLRLHYPKLSGISYEIISYIPSIIGIWITSWFPNWYKEKQMRHIKK